MAALNAECTASEKKLDALTAGNPHLQQVIQQSAEDAAAPEQLETRELLALQGRQKRLQVHISYKHWGVQWWHDVIPGAGSREMRICCL